MAASESDAMSILVFQNGPYKHLDHVSYGAMGMLTRLAQSRITGLDQGMGSEGDPYQLWMEQRSPTRSTRNEFIILSRLRHKTYRDRSRHVPVQESP